MSNELLLFFGRPSRVGKILRRRVESESDRSLDTTIGSTSELGRDDEE